VYGKLGNIFHFGRQKGNERTRKEIRKERKRKNKWTQEKIKEGRKNKIKKHK
jgi:hypothetical protein